MPVALPLLPRGGDAGPTGDAIERATVPAGTTRALRAIGEARGVSMFTVLLAVFHATVNRMSGQRDIAVSSLFANRVRPELQRTVGFLVTLLVLRTRLPDEPTFADTIAVTDRTAHGAFAHQDLPFHGLSPAPPAAPGRRHDDVVFQVVTAPIARRLATAELDLEAVVPEVEGRFDVELAVMPTVGDELAVKLAYDTARLAPTQARTILKEFVALAERAPSAPDVPLVEVPGPGQRPVSCASTSATTSPAVG